MSDTHTETIREYQKFETRKRTKNRIEYRDQGAMGKSYYSGFWQAMKQLNPDMLKYDFLERMCV